jgi:hypothetical protein
MFAQLSQIQTAMQSSPSNRTTKIEELKKMLSSVCCGTFVCLFVSFFLSVCFCALFHYLIVIVHTRQDASLVNFEPLEVPLKPTVSAIGILAEKATIFKSATQPLGLRFATTTPKQKVSAPHMH